jgi:hypothetical protein
MVIYNFFIDSVSFFSDLLLFQDDEEFEASGNDNASDTSSDFCEHPSNSKLFSQNELKDLIRETNFIHENHLSDHSLL